MGAADNFFSKAELAVKKRNYDYAIELYQQGLMIDPDRDEERKKLRGTATRRCQENGGDTTGGRMFGMKNMGQIGKVKKLSIQKKFEEVIVEIEKLLALAPQHSDSLMKLGNAFVNTNRLDSAIQTYMEVVAVDRSNVDAWKALGRLHADKKNVDEAVRCWEHVKQARPDDPEAGKAIRDLSAAQMMARADERRASGDGSFRDLLKDESESEKLEKKAQIIRTEDDARTAIDLKNEEIAGDPENPRLKRELGDLYLKMNDFENAQKSYEEAIAQNPQDMYAQEKISNLRERQFEHALEQAKIKANANPDDAAAKAELEAVQKQLDDFQLEEFGKRVIAHPTDYGLKYKYGTKLFDFERFDEAIAQFQNARKDPKYATGSHHYIGKSFFQKKLFDLAIKEYTNAMGQISEPDSDLGKAVRYDLAEAHVAKGDNDQALEFFEEIMSVDIGYRDVSTRVDQIRGM